MTTVFIGGSRRITHINDTIRSRTNNIINQGMRVLIGDANGADRAMQQYFVNNGYKNVIVYCMGEHCRNNLGNWPAKHISSDRSRRDFAFYATKDLEMAREASYGFMIWDGKSIGTLNNILNLLSQQKNVLVYFSSERTCYTLKSLEELRPLFDKCDTIDRQKFEKVLSAPRQSIIAKPCHELFAQQEHAHPQELFSEVSHPGIASMGWLLSVGAKL